MRKSMYSCGTAREKGATLITGLIFLVVITIIVLSVLLGGSLEERMAANSRNSQVALQAADAVLRDAEGLFNKWPFDPFDAFAFTDDCGNGLCTPTASKDSPKWQQVDWSSSTYTRTFTSNDSKLTELGSQQPRYIVEIVEYPFKGNSAHFKCEPGLVKVIARGEGKNNAVVFVQALYRIVPVNC